MIENIQDKFTPIEKIEIAQKIKPISLEEAETDFINLQKIGTKAETMSPRCRSGNNIVDYFTFVERLNTKGKYDVNFYEFLTHIDEFKKKKFIGTMIKYYNDVKNKNNTKNEYIVFKEIYNICITAINIFRPLVAMEIYSKYKPSCVLDFCAGWGGRLIGACALNVPEYIGIDINTNLEKDYNKIIDFFRNEERKKRINVKTQIKMFYESAVTFDYSKISYDMVLTSPPYYFLEKYSNNVIYHSKTEMKDKFYVPVITNSFNHLKENGHYCLNVNEQIYEDICVKILGKAHQKISLKKSKRQNEYTEYIYIWKKGYKISQIL
jgi:hypothetical protein